MKPGRRDVKENAAQVVEGLAIIQQSINAQLTELEAERVEECQKMERLRAAELAAPRKRRIYFRLARLLRAGAGSEIASSWLRTPEVLEETAKALRAVECAVDRGGLRVVKSYLAAGGRLAWIEDIEAQHRKLYPKLPVPERKLIALTLKRKELAYQHRKPGRPAKG
jgi:hypothetical protein